MRGKKSVPSVQRVMAAAEKRNLRALASTHAEASTARAKATGCMRSKS
jgi:hypothetical protein